MMSDTMIRGKGMEVLAERLGLVEAERFIMMIQKEPFDYTAWQEGLFPGVTVEELAKNAAAYRQDARAGKED